MSLLPTYPLCAILLLIFVCVRYLRGSKQASSISLPPGPKPLPIVGNLLDLPPKGRPAHEHWLKFKDVHGPVSSLSVFGTTLIVLQDHDIARELLVKRSTKTSTRPDQPFGDELCGFGVLLPGQKYHGGFRHHRKLIHQQMGTEIIAAKYNHIQDVESRRFLFRVLADPDNLFQHIKSEAGAIMLRITYGYGIDSQKKDPLVMMIEEMMENFSRAMIPLAWLVDIVPPLMHLPEWFPGASFKKIARQWKMVTETALHVPFTFVREQMAKGEGRYQSSYVSSLVSSYSEYDAESNTPRLKKEDEDAIKSTAAILYGGGADTTVSTIASFILAMMLFPEVQQKAQKEINQVVGVCKLPQFEHRDRLPYINAVVKESLRWFPVVPIGTTHVTEEELFVAGFRIPKGSYLLPSIWWFLHDPKRYENPDTFEPERFLEPRNEPDPASEAFGYGRRICPGRYLANDNLFITISRILAVFNISKAVNAETKEEIEPTVGGVEGLINHPGKFPYCINPKGDEYLDLIRSVNVEHPWDESDAKHLKPM